MNFKLTLLTALGFVLLTPVLAIGGGFLAPMLVPVLMLLAILIVVPMLTFYYLLRLIGNYPKVITRKVPGEDQPFNKLVGKDVMSLNSKESEEYYKYPMVIVENNATDVA